MLFVFPFSGGPFVRLITIHQPWAWLIVSGHKRFENRTWHTSYRGPLLIHSGKSRDSMRAGLALCESLGIVVPSQLDYGAVIGSANLVDSTTADGINDQFAVGPVCFHLADAVQFAKPIFVRGALGLIEPHADILSKLASIMP